ncbi:hypothetical protein [Solwaraspora sp. WMMD792]|uniref:hypothetical protein n=1 Tax=Solwaraspora sp. WMMD792 TaxID=3016099 RepID=UPI002417F2AA|nr:hypothetical protein [Solwaraspora sp. WMMD792]MDG4773359.1 hypothetical protein [Solwaraspora sp. WMMD792]
MPNFHGGRVLAGLLAAAVGTAGTLVATAQPASAGIFEYIRPVQISYTDSAEPTTAFPVTSGAFPVGAWRDDAGDKHTARAYLTFDLTRHQGKQVIEATGDTGETTVTDCAQPRRVELWRTVTPAEPPTWHDAPRTQGKIADVGASTSTCPAPRLEVDLQAALQQAIDEGLTEVTFMLRVGGKREFKPKYGRQMKSLGISLHTNAAPDVPSDLRVSGLPCTNDEVFIGTSTPTLYASVTDPDVDEVFVGDSVAATFAWWPVDQPTERTEWTSSERNAPAAFQRTVPAGSMVDGGRYALAVRAADRWAGSDWSAPCLFAVDTVRPPAPTVTSTDYPSDSGVGSGGPGIPGRFTFSANGADDVVGYRYGPTSATTYVAADQLGGDVTIEYTPTRYGFNRLYVTSVDRTGNRSAQTIYEFFVRDTAPLVADGNPDGWLGDPREFTFTPQMDQVVEYTYWLNNGDPQTVPAGADGSATVTVLPIAGSNTLHVISRTADGLPSGDANRAFHLATSPIVTSEQFPFDGSPGAPAGTEGVFLFQPRMYDVVEYVYTINGGDPQTVAAAADGSAELRYTARDAGYHTIQVHSRTDAGVESESVGYAFYPASVAPTVESDDYPAGTLSGGPGVAGDFTFRPHPDFGQVDGYLYTFGHEPERFVAAGGDGVATVEWTPDVAGNVDGGWVQLQVRSRSAAGVVSDARWYSFRVDLMSPTVESDDFLWWGGGTVGTPGEFRFTAVLAGSVEFVYSFDGGPEQTLPVGPDGTAVLEWTPESPGEQTLMVRSRTADGLESGPTSYPLWIAAS